MLLLFLNTGLLTCTEFSCEFGAECQAVDGGRECVCPDLPCPDTEKEMEVCGEDEKSYANFCDMQQTMCKTQRFINVQHLGKCGMFSDNFFGVLITKNAVLITATKCKY